MKIKIEGGKVYDSKNGIDGQQKDIYVENGSIGKEFPKADITIDARSKTIMAGGIDIHSHVATYGLNLLRGTHGFCSPREIGHIYARMGYTHINEPFMTQYTSNYVHHELSSIPILDTSAFLVINLRDVEGMVKNPKYAKEVEEIIPIIVARAKAIGLKMYEPFVRYSQRMFIMRNVKTKRVLKFFSNISLGSISKMIMHSTPELLDEEIENPSMFHFSHLGGAIRDEEAYERVLTYLKAGASADLGLFDFEHNLRISTHEQAGDTFIGSVDMGFLEPIVFSRGKVLDKKCLFFPLKLALSQPFELISFSTDSPTNASFKAYPKIFSWLMKAENRNSFFNGGLPAFEYSLLDIARITRQNPADVLGIDTKGHLGEGADADIAIYDIHDGTRANELENCFKDCAYLIKGGEIVIEEHKMVNDQVEKKTYCRGMNSLNMEPARVLARHGTFQFENLAADEVFTGKEVHV